MRQRAGAASTIVIASLFLCGFQTTTQSCNNERIGPSGAEVAAAIAGVAVVVVGTVVLIEVNHSHHNIKGCITSGPNGLQLETGGNSKKIYLLSGTTTTIKPGDVVKIHGSKAKKVKGSTADPTFVVAKLSKDYGPCKVLPTPSAATTPATAPAAP